MFTYTKYYTRWLGAFCCFLLATYDANATIWPVGRDKEFVNIGCAMEASLCGDTIRVFSGTYFEYPLYIDKKLVLQGIDNPVIDGEKKDELIVVRSSGSIVEGFTIKNSGYSSMTDKAGIRVEKVRDVIIRNNRLLDNLFGIYFANVTNCIAQNNDVVAHQAAGETTGNAFHAWKADSVKVLNNRVSGHRDGIYFEFVTNSLIEDNNCRNNSRYGLHFMFSNTNAYHNNIFESNGSGVAVMYTKQVTMTGNTFINNWGDAAYGLLLKEISDSEISRNVFENNTMGILGEGSSRIQIHHNTFKSNGWALKIQASCMDLTIERNNFFGNTFDVGTNGSLVLNSFNYNYWDKYQGYDLNKDKIGDVPYRPVGIFSMIIENSPTAMILFRSLIAMLLDKTEKLIPSLTPEHLKDEFPSMKEIEV